MLPWVRAITEVSRACRDRVERTSANGWPSTARQGGRGRPPLLEPLHKRPHL